MDDCSPSRNQNNKFNTNRSVRRCILDGRHLLIWNGGIGPIFNPSKIVKISKSIPQFAQARHWSLRWNQIRKIELTRVDLEHYDIATSIDDLDLSNNEITNLNGQAAPFLELRFLNLSNNRISEITNFQLFSQIKELYLSNNRLTSLKFLRRAQCYSTLEVLDVSRNLLPSLSSIAELVLLNNLSCISLEGNRLPIGYLIEGFVLLACPNLKRFGKGLVTPTIRHEVEFWSTTRAEGSEVVECVNLFREAFFGEDKGRTVPLPESFLLGQKVPESIHPDEMTLDDRVARFKYKPVHVELVDYGAICKYDEINRSS